MSTASLMKSVDNPEQPFAFANNFWGKDDSGVSVLLGHVNNTKHTAEEIKEFYKERAFIEDEYSRRLISLSRKSLGTHEIGTLKEALDTIRTNTENLGRFHSNAAQQFRIELEEPLASFSSNLRSRRKTVQSRIEKLNKEKLYQLDLVHKSKEKFQADSKKINSYYAQNPLLLGKELDRNNQKLDRVRVSVEGTKREYQIALKQLSEITAQWTQEWRIACDKLQDIEEDRFNFLKSNLWAYANVVSTVCVSDDEACENIRISLEKCDVYKDVEQFIQERGTGSKILNPPEFIDFMDGSKDNDLPPTYKVARFNRISANENGVFFNPSASCSQSMIRPSTSLSRSSAASCRSEATDTQTVVITKGALSVPVEMTRQLHQSAGEDADDSASNFTLSANSTTLQSIPVLIHPRESMEDRASPESSNRQQIMSRQGSAYSGTSVSSQSDFEIPPVKQKPHTQPMMLSPTNIGDKREDYNSELHIPAAHFVRKPIQQSAPSPPSSAPAPGINQGEKLTPSRQPWISPFRRRSRKEDSKCWNSRYSTTNDRTNVNLSSPKVDATNMHQSTYRAPFAKPIEVSNKPSVSTVLPMGNDMFDVGGSNRSPFDRRYKPVAPINPLAKDDPLIVALAKLKTTPGTYNSTRESSFEPLLPREQENTAFKQNQLQTTQISPTRNSLHLGPNTLSNKNFKPDPIPSQPASTNVDIASDKRSNYTKVKPDHNSKDYGFREQHLNNSNIQSHSRENSPNTQPVTSLPSNPRQRNNTRPNTMNDYDVRQWNHNRENSSNENYTNSDKHDSQFHTPSPTNRYSGQGHLRGGSASPVPLRDSVRHSMSPNYNTAHSASPNLKSMRQPDPRYSSVSPNPDFTPPRAQYAKAQDNDRSMYRRSASPVGYNRGFPSNPASPQTFHNRSHNNTNCREFAGNKNYGNGSPQYNLNPPTNRGRYSYDNHKEPRSRSALNIRSGGGNASNGGLPGVTRDGRRVLRYCRAAFDYRAAIPEEVGFRAGDILLVVRMLEDGWWESEVLEDGRMGLAPSNFLKNM